MKPPIYFVSYTTHTANDIAWAKWVCWIIENKLNCKTIMQEYDFHPGDNFRERMHDALRRADFVICVLTNAYLSSTNCTDEWTNAKKFIPVKFDNCTPEGLLTSRVYIDLYGLDKNSARDKFVASIQGNVRPIDEPEAPFNSASSPVDEPDFPSSSSDNSTKKHNLPNRNKYFTGRDDILSSIYIELQSSNIASIIGAGGFGKTQIAIEYAYLHFMEYELIWYFNAESEKGLQDEFREFAICNVNMPGAAESEFVLVFRTVTAWLGEQSSYLFIYDNVEGCPNLGAYIQRGQSKKHALFCSRERVRGIVSKKLDVKEFSFKDAVDFIHNRVPDVNSRDTEELANALNCMPLALECAVAYIEENDGYTLSLYLKNWQDRKIDFLNERPTATDYDLTILTTWDRTFEKLTQEAERDEQSKAAEQLFRLLIYCAPDDIPLQFFINGREKIPQPLGNALVPDKTPEHDSVLIKLSRYSLISIRRNDDNDVFISMHRLIQEVANHYFEYNKEWVNCCLNIAISVFGYQYGSKKDFINFSKNLPHIIKITQYANAYLDDDESKKKFAKLYNEIGIGLQSQGDYSKALEWYYKALEIREKVMGPEYPDTALIYNSIAGVYLDQGDFAKALEWYYKASDINIKVFGSEHPNTARTYNNIALVFSYQGDYIKALEWYYKALAINEKILEPEHPDTARTYNNIAGVYRNQGDYAKALGLYYKALTIREKVLGLEHPDTATTYNNIAGVYQGQGDFAKALEWLYKALAIREKVLGPEHPDTAATYNNIALVFNNQGDFAKALEWYYKALAICEKVLGSEHPHTAAAYNNIAGVYKDQGDFAKALELYYMSLAIREKVLGPGHPDMATTYNNIAHVFNNQGDYTKALEWFYKALAICKKELGPEHPHTAATYNNIAYVFYEMGKFLEARDLFLRAVIIFDICKLTDHPHKLNWQKNMHTCYIKAGGKEENFENWVANRVETYPAWCVDHW